MASMTDKQKEEAYIQSYIKMLKDLTKSGDQLNGVQLKGVADMTKWMTQMTSNDKVTKAQLTLGKKNYDLGIKQQKIDVIKKKMDEVQIRLRHGYKLQEEKEHGEQVRRNIQLRQMHEGFTQGFDMLRKSLFGGFGFQAAIGTTVKKMAGMTRNFNELQVATRKLEDSQETVAMAETNLNEAEADLAHDSNDPDGEKAAAIKKAEMELHFAMMDEVRAQSGVDSATDLAKGTQGKMTKPIFEKLGKLGEFLGKKAVPIGIGMGVAGVLMSVIVKAFSASPLFAAMMKMMKFMVTLILMPIGTFFGALLRPILIMLLRKFIIPFYSTYMPYLMKLGTDIGNFITDPTGLGRTFFSGGDEESTGIVDETIKKNEELKEKGEPEGGEVIPVGEAVLSNFLVGIWEQITKGAFMPSAFGDEYQHPPKPDDYDPNAGYADGKFQPKDGGTYDPYAEENQKYGKVDPNDITGVMGSIDYAMNKEQLDAQAAIEEEWNQKQLQAEDQLKLDAQLAAIKEEAAEAEKQWHIENAANMAAEREAKAEAEAKKQAAIDQKAAADAKAAAVDKRLKEALAKMEMERIEEIREAQMLRNAQQVQVDQVNSKFAGTLSAGKLSSSKNAGMDVGAAMDKNASKGHVKLSQSNMNLSQATRDLLASMNSGVIPAAEGFDGMINSPTLFMAGEAGAEHVKITPNGQGGGSNITVNIQNMNAGDDDLRKLKKTILEVIQQSANNRGRI